MMRVAIREPYITDATYNVHITVKSALNSA